MKVKTIRRKETTKELVFDDDSTLEVATSARVGKDDEVVKRGREHFVVCARDEFAQISPPLCIKTTLNVGALKLPVEIKEPMTQQEFDDIDWLSHFHYLGENCLKLSTLILTTSMPNLPHTLGFLILATPFNACKPRTPLLRALLPSDRYMPSWFAVRAVRLVVHPEFRGTGIATVLMKAGIEYSKKRFAIKAHKPLIYESVAAMHRYMPWTHHYMHYLDDTASAQTSGLATNVKRILQTLDNKTGVDEYHRAYALRAQAVAEALDIELDALLEMVTNPDSLTIEQLVDIQSLLHSPKPYYAVGLTDEAERVVASFAREVVVPYVPKERRIKSSIKFKDIEVVFAESAKATQRTFVVQGAFGVSPRGFKTTVLSGFSLEIKAGEVVLLTGISGSGKSIVLRALRNELNIERGYIFYPSNAKIAVLDTVKSDEPLIDLVGKSVEEALSILNRVGLGEAKIYLKAYKALSTGQKYRASIARLMDSDANIWIADEFGSTLDVITANIVAHAVQRYCRQTGITFIAACANPECYLESLKPDYIIDLSAGRVEIKQTGGSYDNVRE